MPRKKKQEGQEERQEKLSTAFEIMDREDERLIVEEIIGKMLDTYVYEIEIEKGKKVYGLSVAGVADACRYISQRGEFIRIEDPPQIICDDDGCLANVIAKRYIRSVDGSFVCADAALGTKYEPRVKLRRDGTPWTDRFYREVAVSKAERNAKLKLIPETVKIMVINKYKEMKKGVKKLEPPKKERKPVEKAKPKAEWKPDANIIEIQKLKSSLIKLGHWTGDAGYRLWLRDTFGVESSKELTDEQKAKAIEILKRIKEDREAIEKEFKKEIEEMEREQKELFDKGGNEQND